MSCLLSGGLQLVLGCCMTSTTLMSLRLGVFWVVIWPCWAKPKGSYITIWWLWIRRFAVLVANLDIQLNGVTVFVVCFNFDEQMIFCVCVFQK